MSRKAIRSVEHGIAQGSRKSEGNTGFIKYQSHHPMLINSYSEKLSMDKAAISSYYRFWQIGRASLPLSYFSFICQKLVKYGIFENMIISAATNIEI